MLNFTEVKLSFGNSNYVCRIIDILYKNKSMKTLSITSFFVVIAAFSFTTLRAQTADDIVGKYISAVGGKDAVAAVKSVVMVGTSSVSGFDGNTTITLVVGKGFKTESDFNGQKVIQAITPTSGWGVNAFIGAPTPTALPAEAVKAGQVQLQFDPLGNYAANGSKIELAGKDSADYKIKVSGGQNTTYYINQKTYLLDKLTTTITAMGQQAEVTLTFSDYRKGDGGTVLVPYSENIDYPQASVAVIFKTITVNSTVDPTVFDMPKQ
jgi:hypothetical protein